MHLIEGTEKKQWDRFHALCTLDEPYGPILAWARAEAADPRLELVIVSGRPDTYRRQMIAWMREHCIEFSRLLMRRRNDFRPDDVVKNEILDEIGAGHVLFVVDDRPRVVEMWRRNGLKVFPVHQERWAEREPAPPSLVPA